MIARLWHGWTTTENADTYEALLKSEILSDIVARKIEGFRKIELLRRPLGSEVEFVTIMWFSSLDAIKAFAGDNYEAAVVPPAARALLSRFDATSQHYDVREERKAGSSRVGNRWQKQPNSPR